MTRTGGQVKFASMQTLEKIPRQDRAHGDAAFPGTDRCRSSPIRSSTWPRGRLGGGVEGRLAGQRNDRRLLQAAGRHLVAGGGQAVPRRAQPRSEGHGVGLRLLHRARAAACVDAAVVDFTEHHSGRVSHQRDSVGGQGDARRPAAPRRGSGQVPRAGEEGHQRPRDRGPVRRRAAVRRRRSPSSIPRRFTCSKAR